MEFTPFHIQTSKMADSRRQFKELLLQSFLLLLCFCTVAPKRTKEKIYIDIVSQNGCFRLLNATHQIGCSSDQGGNTGVVHYMQTEQDWTYVLEKGTTGPYVPVLESDDFTIVNVRRLISSRRVSGIAVLNINLDSDLKESFSADKSCPNDAYGMYHGTSLGNCAKVEWNPVGNGLFFDDLNVPVFSITNAEDADNILKKCWEPFNKPLNGKSRTFPLCAMELVADMAAAKDTETCLRRSNVLMNLKTYDFCDPLGDQNIVATLKAVPSNQTREEKSVIVVATRMDTLGMFFNQFPSSDTSVTGIVTLLAAAKTLWKLQEEITAQSNAKDVMFTFLQGEAFDYIGSSRMVYDMKKGRFPVDFSEKDHKDLNLQKIDLTHVAQFVELNQVGMREDGNSLWLHVDPGVRSKTKVQPLLDKLTALGNQTNTRFQSPDPSHPLPSASLQWFLKEAGDSPFPSFVVTDHQDRFTNKYYNSHRDLPSQIKADYPEGMKESEKYDADTLQSRRITDLATALARYLFWASTGQDPNASQLAKLQADIMDVNHMLYCFLHSPRCELFNFTISPDDADAHNKNYQPYPFYVTVNWLTSQVTILTQRIMALFTGQVVPNVTQDKCSVQDHDKRYTYLWMQGGESPASGRRSPVCYRSTAMQTKAVSPAFHIDDYDMKSGRFSSWTESRWEKMRVRVFLKPSKQFETRVLSAGVIVFLISLILVYWVNSKAYLVFAAPHGTSRERLMEFSL